MKKAIVITHGLFMKKEVMSFLKKIEKYGYKVYNYGYETRNFNDKTIENFKEFIKKIPERNVYFVGHSLGGLLIRRYFEIYKPKFSDTCIVTLGTPHNGSSFAKIIDSSFLSVILGTSKKSGLVSGLNDWNPKLADLGCIVGTLNIGLNSIFNSKRGLSDGTVLVSEAIAKNAKDYVKINLNHTMLIYSNESINLINYFILNRKFK